MLEVPIVGLEVVARRRDAELTRDVLNRRVEPVSLGYRLGQRILDAQALDVLPVVGAEGIEQMVLIDELAPRVERRATKAGRLSAPVPEPTVHLAGRVLRAGQRDDVTMPGRQLGAEHGRAHAFRRSGRRGEGEREGGHDRGRRDRCARSAHC